MTAKNDNSATAKFDTQCMRQCIAVAAEGAKMLDFPFGALVVHDGRVISCRHNEALDSKQVYRHAELLALADAQRELTASQLKEVTLYSTVEPCAMCAFAVQELGIKRVVFGLRSPIMGGFSKWPVLQDAQLGEAFPNTFGKAPEIVPDFLKEEVIAGWRTWNEERWQKFVSKHVFC